MRYEITSSEVFNKWLRRLRDRQATLAIANRITRATAGNLGDVKPVGEGISEIRIFVGKGYRIYFCLRAETLIFLLCGGDKSSQQKDIERAKMLAKEIKP